MMGPGGSFHGGSAARPYIIWWAIAVHLVWAVSLLTDPETAPAVILVGMHWIIATGLDGPRLGAALLVAVVLALVSLVGGHRLSNRTALLLLMPQYFLLVAAFLSDSGSVWSGTVAGREVDRLLLFDALWPTMAAAVLHSIAIIERHRTWIRR